VAVLNAVCWSVITPPFQVPDEPSHFAYVKQLAEEQALPSSSRQEFSREEVVVLEDLRQTPYMPATGGLSTRAQQEAFVAQLDDAAAEPREGSPAAGVATSQPPLYYALEAIPYLIGYGGNALVRLELMRLLSALFAGLTALFTYSFLRETLRERSSGPVVGGLCVAFAPLLGFMSGAVNPDSLLFAISAALFWALARAFRRGLTYRGTALLGGLIALGLITKLNFAGLLPGALAGLAILALREARRRGASAWRLFALGLGVAVSPLVPYAIANALGGHPVLGLLSSSLTLVHGSPLAAAEYIWKLFLPPLPGMRPYAGGIFSTRAIWFNGFVGQYGWLETVFPDWVYDVALVVGVAILLALGRALVAARRSLRARWAELAVWALMAAGLAVLVGAASYYSAPGAGSYTQARYLLPLIPLFAAALALAARAGGRRWEGALGILIVLAIFADDIFSQLLVVGRFYG
jgi:4-amino-4-deoxy-L-arabinose transferase-like glycosyltransferase